MTEDIGCNNNCSKKQMQDEDDCKFSVTSWWITLNNSCLQFGYYILCCFNFLFKGLFSFLNYCHLISLGCFLLSCVVLLISPLFPSHPFPHWCCVLLKCLIRTKAQCHGLCLSQTLRHEFYICFFCLFFVPIGKHLEICPAKMHRTFYISILSSVMICCLFFLCCNPVHFIHLCFYASPSGSGTQFQTFVQCYDAL